MRNPGSYLSVSAEDKLFRKIRFQGKIIEDAEEVDCFTCQHCNKIVPVKPMCDPADAGGLCKQCMGLICEQCYGKRDCTPLMKKIEQVEDKARFLRQMQEWG